jgi:hypothetical protein
MSRIAVDVVLLPPDEIMDRAIHANAKLAEQSGDKIVLNKEDCLPHISLAMGCIDESDIPSIEWILKSIADTSPLGDLTVTGFRASTNAKGEKVSVLEIGKSKELQALHEKVMEKLLPYFSPDVTDDMIYGDEDVAETTLRWIQNYPEKASFANFFPHITIGYGQTDAPMSAVAFKASKLALCHLGNHCTCRRVVASANVTPGKTGG